MPFQSEAQRRFMWAKHPEIARRWTKEYGSMPRKSLGSNNKKDSKGASGPGKGMPIGSHGEGILPYRMDAERTQRVQGRVKYHGAISRRLAKGMSRGGKAGKAFKRSGKVKAQVSENPPRNITPGMIAARERNFHKTPVGLKAQQERNRLGRKSGETSARQQREDRARAARARSRRS